jgi:diacylglycerol kinase (ATP)
MNQIPDRKSGLSRIWSAFFYSLDGLRHAITNETAFIQEAIIFLVALIALVFLPLTLLWKALLVFVTASVLIVELLNSAVEALVDMVSPEYHELAKRAKDLGSAAVLLSIVIALLLWAVAVSSIL